MDAVAALSAGAAARGIHLGQCRVFLSRHHAGRRHADHRDGGDERLPQGTARQDSGPQRTPADPTAGTAADGLGGGRRAHFPGARGHTGRADRAKLPSVANNIRQGTLEGFDAGQGVAIGRRLADQLSLRVGDSVTLVAPRGAVTPMGTTPRIKPYKVAAVFEVGMSEYDSAFVFMPLPESQAYFNRAGDVTAIEVYVEHPDDIDRYRKLITESAGR